MKEHDEKSLSRVPGVPGCQQGDLRGVRHGGIRRRFWTPVEDAALRLVYPWWPTARLAHPFGRTIWSVNHRAEVLGLHKSAAYRASPEAQWLRRNADIGAPFRFQKGHVPANKGVRRPGWSAGRMRETQFKKGERRGAAAINWRPIGTLATDPEGYQRIKIREARPGEAYGFGNVGVWPLLQRHVWRTAHGAIPPGHVIVFKDGNRANCILENLDCIARRALMARNTVHNLPKPLAQTIQLLGALNRQVRRRTRDAALDR